MLKEFHVPQASDTTPGSTAADPTDAAYVSKAPVTISVSAGRSNSSAHRRQDRPDRRAVRLDLGQPARIDPRLGDPLGRPAARRHVVRRPGPGVAPVDHRPSAHQQRVELVPVHEPAGLGDRGRVGGAPPERPVDRVHPARHVAGQALPLLGGPARRRLRGHVIARVCRKSSGTARAASPSSATGKTSRPDELNEIATGGSALQAASCRHLCERGSERLARLEDVDLAMAGLGAIAGTARWAPPTASHRARTRRP